MRTLVVSVVLFTLACSAEAKLPAGCHATINGVVCDKPKTVAKPVLAAKPVGKPVKRGALVASPPGPVCHTWMPVFSGLSPSSGPGDTYLHFSVAFVDANTGAPSGKVIDVRVALDGSAVLGPQSETLEAPVAKGLLQASIQDPSGFQTEIDAWNKAGQLNSYYPN